MVPAQRSSPWRIDSVWRRRNHGERCGAKQLKPYTDHDINHDLGQVCFAAMRVLERARERPERRDTAGAVSREQHGRRCASRLTAMATSATPQDERRRSPWPLPSPRPSPRGRGRLRSAPRATFMVKPLPRGQARIFVGAALAAICQGAARAPVAAKAAPTGAGADLRGSGVSRDLPGCGTRACRG
jgi:transposase